MIVRRSSLVSGACLAAFLVVGTATAVTGQTVQSSDWEVPRTAWGHPDLQGNWTNVTITPFERPDGQGPVLTPEEVAEFEGRAVSRIERGAQPSDPNRPPPEAGGGVGGYNNVYIDRGTNIAIVNGEYRSSLVTKPSDGRIPELTAQGRERLAAYRATRASFDEYDHPEIRPLGERCIMSFGSSAGPPMIPNTFYNNNYTIVQNSDHVLIMSEMVHDARIIRLGDGPRLPPHIRPWMGDSWGHWEDDTLVVETTNIYPFQTFRGMPPSEHLKVIERYTRVDEETILYEFTIDDPTTYTQPWGGEIPLKPLGDLLFEYACHEGNYALSNILSGARYQESLEDDQSGRD